MRRPQSGRVYEGICVRPEYIVCLCGVCSDLCGLCIRGAHGKCEVNEYKSQMIYLDRRKMLNAYF